MKSDILSQDFFENMLKGIVSWDKKKSMRRSHSALLNRVAKLEEENEELSSESALHLNEAIVNDKECGERDKRIAELEKINKENDSAWYERYTRMRDQLSEKLLDCVELEKELAQRDELIAKLEDNDSKEVIFLERKLKESESRLSDSLRKIAELERQLADKEKDIVELVGQVKYNGKLAEDWMAKYQNMVDNKPKRSDTEDEAELKAREKIAEFLRRGIDFEFRNNLFYRKYIVNECLQEPDGGSPEYYEFPYFVPREPQVGDLMSSKKYDSVFTLGEQNEHIFYARTGAAYEKEDCKSTGLRWDTETKSIVKIED